MEPGDPSGRVPEKSCSAGVASRSALLGALGELLPTPPPLDRRRLRPVLRAAAAPLPRKALGVCVLRSAESMEWRRELLPLPLPRAADELLDAGTERALSSTIAAARQLAAMAASDSIPLWRVGDFTLSCVLAGIGG